MIQSSRFKRRLFFGIALLIPVLVLLIAETALRLTGFGQSIPLFVPSSVPGYLVPNSQLVKRYFHLGAIPPKVSPDTYFFKATKPQDSLRLVVMGGSTAAGFPYGRFGSPAGFIEQQVRALYPDKNIEIISVAMSSINSYTLRDVAPEVAEINPDAVLIYAGHNEYLGIMGTASGDSVTNNHLTKLLFLTLKESRLFQLLQSVFAAPPPFKEKAGEGRTVMALLAQNSEITYDSAQYHAGLLQFESNMRAVTEHFENAGVPVFLSTIASNERDQAPFLSALSGHSANEAFESGTMLYDNADYTAALEQFQHAIDYDLLRFRAPREINRIIKILSSQPNTILVDAEQALRNDTEHGIIGKAHMVEHLHPNERGYFVIAKSFLTALQGHGLLPLPTVELSDISLWQTRPLSEVDSETAKLKVKRLTSDYPFRPEPVPFVLAKAKDTLSTFTNNRFNGESWLSQQPQLLNYYQKNNQWDKAATVAAALSSALPFEADPARAASQLLLRTNRLSEAWFYARRAVELMPNEPSPGLTLAEIHFKRGDTEKAISLLKSLKERFTSDPRPDFYLKQLKANTNE